jgi:hypothetical protein
MRKRSLVVIPLAIVAATAGCGSDGPASGEDVARVDSTTDAAEAPDAIEPGDLVSEASEDDDTPGEMDGIQGDAWEAEAGDLGPPEVAQASEPQPLPVAEWITAMVADPDQDPVGDALETGTFEPPAGPGVDAHGVTWSVIATGKDGEIGWPGFSLYYGVARIQAPEPTGLLARSDLVYRIFVNGVPQPGDVYGTGRHRTPARALAGENVVVVQTWRMGGGQPRVKLFSTGDELAFNLEDVTGPDLVAGEAADQYLGVPVANLTGQPVRDVTARVLGSDVLVPTETTCPSLPPAAVTKIAFRLAPKTKWPGPGQQVTARLHVESPSLQWAYERDVALATVAGDAPYRRTFLSAMDGSAQYFGVLPPKDPEPGKAYALVLSLHGAGVDAIGLTGSYTQKDWAFIINPTNRRPFGFDWEAWGRLDGIEVLDHASTVFPVDPRRVYLTGHSMGGHGTWQLGVLFPGRFAVVGPSAGWNSFYSYTGQAKPTGPVGRARASSDTIRYVGNLARRAVYMIHGDKDDNVPLSEGQLMADAVGKVTTDFQFHIEPGAGHWWDNPDTPGVDCVDWLPLMDLMQARTLDPCELDFTFTTPSPAVNPTHSYVTIRSEEDPFQDCVLTSSAAGDSVELTTANVRGMRLDGGALLGKGVTKLSVDGSPVALTDGTIEVGPQDGKQPNVHGPFEQVFRRPFCLAYPDDGPQRYREYAAWLVSEWDIVGNGLACALPLSAVDEGLRAARNIVYLGVPRGQVPWGEDRPLDWDDSSISLGGKTVGDAALAFVYPDHDRLSAVLWATKGSEHLLARYQPFSSRAGMPDYFAWSEDGLVAAGFFSATWQYDPKLGVGP